METIIKVAKAVVTSTKKAGRGSKKSENGGLSPPLRELLLERFREEDSGSIESLCHSFAPW